MKKVQADNSNLLKEKRNFIAGFEENLGRLECDNLGLRNENQLMKTDIQSILEERDDILEKSEVKHKERELYLLIIIIALQPHNLHIQDIIN